MLELLDGLMLYHASYCEIVSPNLSKCSPFKDFGRGFYLTSSYEQAKSFISTSLKKAKSQGLISENQNYGVITSFRYNASNQVKVKLFSDADSDWLHCVVAHRKANTFPELLNSLEQYDVIAGKIADDATNFTIIAYIAGTYGDIGSVEADELCIKRLIPERLENQYCFRTQEALDCLEGIGSEVICKN